MTYSEIKARIEELKAELDEEIDVFEFDYDLRCVRNHYYNPCADFGHGEIDEDVHYDLDDFLETVEGKDEDFIRETFQNNCTNWYEQFREDGKYTEDGILYAENFIAKVKDATEGASGYYYINKEHGSYKGLVEFCKNELKRLHVATPDKGSDLDCPKRIEKEDVEPEI